MKSIKNDSSNLYIINKSKFYSFACFVANEDDVKIKLETIRKEYCDATHICYAYVLSCPNVERCSDDGEPSGTAGKPILELIKKKNLNNVLIVVVRYFGGIKLGAGGLVRAYTEAGVRVIEKSEIVEMEYCEKLKVVIDIARSNTLIKFISGTKANIISTKYGERLELIIIGNIAEELNKNFESIIIENLGRDLICKQ